MIVNTKIALITTVNDKNCTYLIKHLLKEGYKVHELRIHANSMKDRLVNFFQYNSIREVNYTLHDIKDLDTENLIQIVKEIHP